MAHEDKLTDADIARFWTLVGKDGPDDCWPWLGSASAAFKLGKYLLRPRRVACYLEYGTAGKFTLHTCQNPWCLNPRHLNPSNTPISQGRGLPAATVLLILQLRQRRLTIKKIATQLGLKYGTVWAILYRESQVELTRCLLPI
jgi:hypothetical protein